MKKNLLWLLVPALLMFATTSCVSHKPIQYVEQNFDTASVRTVKWKEIKIETNDLISIVVSSDNLVASASYNQGSISASSFQTNSGIATSNTNSGVSGYSVDTDGLINILGIGKWKVAGKTRAELSKELVDYFIKNNLLKNPIVEVKFLNFKITILGEVQRPGSFSMPNERLNVLEALGLAGDFTPFANKQLVTVIRENEGERQFGKLDLNSATIFNSEFFQLKQNDIVIVPATKKKELSNDQLTLRYITIGTSLLTAVAILTNLIK